MGMAVNHGTSSMQIRVTGAFIRPIKSPIKPSSVREDGLLPCIYTRPCVAQPPTEDKSSTPPRGCREFSLPVSYPETWRNRSTYCLELIFPPPSFLPSFFVRGNFPPLFRPIFFLLSTFFFFPPSSSSSSLFEVVRFIFGRGHAHPFPWKDLVFRKRGEGGGQVTNGGGNLGNEDRSPGQV